MKNKQKGFVVPLLIGIIAVLIMGGVYVYSRPHKQVTPVTNTVVAATSTSIISTTTTDTQSIPQIKRTVEKPINKSIASSSEPLHIKVLSPNGGENIKIGETIQIKWSTNKILPPGYIFVINGPGIQFNVNASATTTLYSHTITVNNLQFTSDLFDYVAAGTYKLKISLYDGVSPIYAKGKTCPDLVLSGGVMSCSDAERNGTLLAEDQSDNSFTITTETNINLLSPKGGESIQVSNDASARMLVSYSGNLSGLPLYYLIDSSGNTLQVNEVSRATDCSGGCKASTVYVGVTSIKPGQYKLKVCDPATKVCDESANYFTITD